MFPSMKKKQQQKYNVIFMWDKRPNLNPNLALNLFLFFIDLNNFGYGRFQLNNKGSYP
jgi:hypothetical protein